MHFLNITPLFMSLLPMQTQGRMILDPESTNLLRYSLNLTIELVFDEVASSS